MLFLSMCGVKMYHKQEELKSSWGSQVRLQRGGRMYPTLEDEEFGRQGGSWQVQWNSGMVCSKAQSA